MTGIVEAAAITAMTCTATATLSLAGYANVHTCTDGIFKKRAPHSQNHHLEPPHHPTLHHGPMVQAGVAVRLNDKSIGTRKVQFNGEILSMNDEHGNMVRKMALGATAVKVNGNRVVVTPGPSPTLDFTFPNQDTAQKWATEFKDAGLVGGPEERIHELISHSVNVHKHLKDLRGRAEKSTQHAKEIQKLKKQMSLSKIGLAGAEADEPKRVASSALTSWFAPRAASSAGPASSDELAKLNEELQHDRDLIEKAKAQEEFMKAKLGENGTPDVLHLRVFKCWSLEVRRTMTEKAKCLGDENKKMQDQVAELQGLLSNLTGRPRPDFQLAAATPVSQQPDSTGSDAGTRAAGQELAIEPQRTSDLDRRFGESQSPPPRRNNQEENRSANMPARRQAGSSPDKEPLKENEVFNGMGKPVIAETILDKQVYDDKVSRLGAMEQRMRQQLELRKAAPPTVFSSLEERIRSRQLQANADLDILQQMFQDNLVDQRSSANGN